MVQPVSSSTRLGLHTLFIDSSCTSLVSVPSFSMALHFPLSPSPATKNELTNRRFENNQSTGGIVENNILSGAFVFGIVCTPLSFESEADNIGSCYSSRFRYFEQFFRWQCFFRRSPFILRFHCPLISSTISRES